MIDPGTALAIVGLVLDVTKDLYEYYSLWKGRDEDITEVRLGLLWLSRLFGSIRLTLKDAKSPPDHEALICQSMDSCRTVIEKLEKRLRKCKKEGSSATLLQKVGDQARRTLYPFQRGTISRLIENIDDCKTRLHLVISLVNMDASAKGLQELKNLDEKVTSAASTIDAIHRLVHDNHEGDDRQKIFDWLRPVDQSDLQAAAIRRHETGTGEWFLKGPEFNQWKQQPNSSLWMYGSVGCGKTVLFSTIVKHLESASVSQPGICSLAYFYCLYRKGAQHTLAAILQSFIVQLCSQNRIPIALRDLYQLHNKKFPPGVPSDAELKAILMDVIQSSINSLSDKSSNIYLLIDALDEWPAGSERDELLSYLGLLGSTSTPCLHILVISRDESDIREMLVESFCWTSLSINRDRVSDDMKLYVNNHVEQHPRLAQKSPEIKDQIMQRLVTEGNGIFRWAALQLEAIKRLRPMNPKTITQTLHSLPRDLDDTYEAILSKIAQTSSKEALTALSWIAFATRPLLIEELMDACVIENSRTRKINQQFDSQNRFTQSDIVDLLPGLLTINPPFQGLESFQHGVHEVTFAHFSVQEYLLGERIRTGTARVYALEPRISNHALSRDCLAYLSSCNILSLRTEIFPLRGYAWDYWAWHAQFETSKSQDQIGTDAQTLFTSIVHLKSKDDLTSLEKLLSLLSDVAVWDGISRSAKVELLDCLRTPFFYDEFNNIIDQNASDPRSSLRQYNYSPLRPEKQEVRLFELFPSPKAFTEIRCKMLTVSLYDEPQFDALSYVWGNPLHVGYIRMDGLLLQIPNNLIGVLRNFRGKSNNSKRVLFADAICFDRHVVPEKDITTKDLNIMMSPRMRVEREDRIKLSPRIFKTTQQVAIGLGDRDEGDAQAIEFVTKIASKSFEESKNEKNTKPSLVSDTELGASLLQLFQRKWWLRSWPIQELILPSRATVYYGDLAVPFENFQKLFWMEHELRTYIDAHSYDMLMANRAWIGAKRVSMLRLEYAQGRLPQLPELLWATQFHESRRSREKIYALLGLLSLDQDKSDRLLIKYSSDVNLYIQVATYIITQEPNLDILSYASCHPFWSPSADDYCPSWVPNFSIGQTISPLILGSFGPHDHEDLYDAGKYLGLPEKEVSQDTESLLVEGFEIDTVKVTSNPFLDETNADVLNYYNDLMHTTENLRLPPNQSSLEAYWRTIHLDQWEGRRLSEDIPSLIKKASATIEEATKLAQTNGLFDIQYCKGRHLFLTSLGYFGLGPVNLKTGDLVTILPGGKVPYILRSEGASHILIGEGYVHGVMYGEAMEAFENGEYQLKEFCLV